jgi:hypothetical protein
MQFTNVAIYGGSLNVSQGGTFKQVDYAEFEYELQTRSAREQH